MSKSAWQAGICPNRFYCGDNLEILAKVKAQSINLIYLDPPFNKNKQFHSSKRYAPTSFNDNWKHTQTNGHAWDKFASEQQDLASLVLQLTHNRSYDNLNYLQFMTLRLVALKRVLATNGTIYLHCDLTMCHYLKIILDEIFGPQNFRNQIIWCYRFGGHSKRGFSQKHDVIFRYSNSDDFVFNHLAMRRHETTSNWPPHPDGKLLTDWWIDIPSLNTMAKERTGYPTQKPLSLLQRIITASSNPNDLVLDPFCGSGTACVAAKQLNRKWIGIDANESCGEIINSRLAAK